VGGLRLLAGEDFDGGAQEAFVSAQLIADRETGVAGRCEDAVALGCRGEGGAHLGVGRTALKDGADALEVVAGGWVVEPCGEGGGVEVAGGGELVERGAGSEAEEETPGGVGVGCVRYFGDGLRG
jgi:hypothetical protein